MSEDTINISPADLYSLVSRIVNDTNNTYVAVAFETFADQLPTMSVESTSSIAITTFHKTIAAVQSQMRQFATSLRNSISE